MPGALTQVKGRGSFREGVRRSLGGADEGVNPGAPGFPPPREPDRSAPFSKGGVFSFEMIGRNMAL